MGASKFSQFRANKSNLLQMRQKYLQAKWAAQEPGVAEPEPAPVRTGPGAQLIDAYPFAPKGLFAEEFEIGTADADSKGLDKSLENSPAVAPKAVLGERVICTKPAPGGRKATQQQLQESDSASPPQHRARNPSRNP